MNRHDITFVDELDLELYGNVLTVTFTKKNGETRIMRCTRMSELIPKESLPKSGSNRKKNDDIMTVWDLDKKNWRAITKSSIICYAPYVPTPIEVK